VGEVGEEQQDLVRAAQQGAEPEAHRAFAALVHSWQHPLHRFLRSRIRDPQAAEEALHETFVEAWKSIRGLRDPAGFQPWIFRIAWVRVVRHYEGKAVTPPLTLVEQDLLEERTAYAPYPVRDDLREAMATMPPDDLRLLLDKYESQLTYGQIAEREGIAVSTVRDRLRGARDRLSRVLQRAGLFELFANDIEARRRRRQRGAGPAGGTA
jgi:RNA polymerase sigma-70 factor (ECF subfamily)